MWNLVSRVALSALFASVFLTMLAHIARAEPLSLQPRYVVGPVAAPEPQTAPAPVRAAATRGSMGGGFFEAVFGGGDDAAPYAGQRSAYAAYYAARGLSDEGA